MINKRITQIILLTAGICLIVLTYFIYPKKQDIVLTENKIVKEDETSENTFENISYSGFTPEGELFEIKSKLVYQSFKQVKQLSSVFSSTTMEDKLQGTRHIRPEQQNNIFSRFNDVTIDDFFFFFFL